MKYLRPARIFNLTQNTLLAKKVILADTPLKRITGLLGKTGLKEKEALVILPCKQVHTFFMRFSIDILFLDKENKVISALSNFKPYRITPLYFSALSAIELPAGTIESSCTVFGDEISLDNSKNICKMEVCIPD